MTATESVWDYPRPPRLEPTSRRIRVVFGGVTIVDSTRALRLLETSHPPTYYVPIADVLAGHLRAVAGGSTFCEWKGLASYFDVVAGGREAHRAAWTYPNPSASYAALRDRVAFYAEPMDACHVDDERVLPQKGSFYGGWITSDIAGPFKGGPGTAGW
jgi:uncharacterized protein (DUF427 family)